jgi:hypothetical protein
MVSAEVDMRRFIGRKFDYAVDFEGKRKADNPCMKLMRKAITHAPRVES